MEYLGTEYPCGCMGLLSIRRSPFTTLEYIRSTKLGLRSNPDLQVETHNFYQRTISFSILGCSLVEKNVLLRDRIQAFKKHL